MKEDLPFANREEAGIRLGKLLLDEAGLGEDCLILGLVRGGAEIAYHLSATTGVAWDIMIVRKIGAPSQPEYALGAYAESGAHFLNEQVARQMGLDASWFDQALRRARQECSELQRELRGGGSQADLAGRRVILTDDGIATGMTMRAAMEAARRAGAKQVIVAVPVLAMDARDMIREAGFELHYLACPPAFHAVGQFYRNFGPVTSETVRRLLQAREPGAEA